MRAAKLRMACPVCGSADVFYTCTPNCCLNHLCGDCGATFEPATRALGHKRNGIERPDPPPEAADPTAECAVCHSTEVYSVEGELGCAACGAALTLEYTEVAPG